MGLGVLEELLLDWNPQEMLSLRIQQGLRMNGCLNFSSILRLQESEELNDAILL